jgi:hypothetical protein
MVPPDSEIQLHDLVVDASVPWDHLRALRVWSIKPTIECGLLEDHFHQADPITYTSADDLIVSPFSMAAMLRKSPSIAVANLVRDLSSALIRAEEKVSTRNLCAALAADDRLSSLGPDVLEKYVKCCVASKILEVVIDRKTQEVQLRLSKLQAKLEETRTFAGSFASELGSLSERIRLLVKHPGSVGTYRENILQSLLKRHLPERYHVATGFVLGCDRQIDVLIYDRIDYAPVFREGDLVVVPPQAVRAVIEVKTNLSLDALYSSLSLVSQVSEFDDASPPFFKGVFAFESGMSEQAICDNIIKFHVGDPGDLMEYQPHLIFDAYQHFSCVCVLGKTFAYSDYEKDDRGTWLPVLKTKQSVSRMEAQAAYFLQMLLAHLRFSTLKAGAGRELETMLGSDTRDLTGRSLVGPGPWGLYFAESESDLEEPAVAQANRLDMEKRIAKARVWLRGD